MTKVGSDKRLNYYQQTVEQVLGEVRSHPYGLTNPEAARRVSANGFNRLPPVNDQNWSTLALEQAQTPTVLILVACLAVSWYLGAGSTAWASFIAVLAVIAFGVRRELRTSNITYHLDKYLPEKVSVLRNNKEKSIDALELALGDIVLLGPGNVVPADLRLVEVDGLEVDEAMLFGGSGHVHKYTKPLGQTTPLRSRHNLAFQGTTVASGSGTGIVVASGGQTELGRLLHLSRTTTDHRSLFSTSFAKLNRTFGLTALVLVIVLALVADWSGFAQHNGLLSLQTILAVLAPAGIALTATFMFGQFKRLSRRRGVHVESLAAVDRLARIDIMLLDEAGFITTKNPLAKSFIVGKREFTNPAETYDPAVRLRGPTGRKLGAGTIKELGLFFDALALGSETTLLPPDKGQPGWHVAGTATDGALVVLAAQAGIDIGAARREHNLLHSFHHDTERGMSSVIRNYDHRNLVLSQGSAETVLAKATKIWDGGHTRKLTAADKKRLDEFTQAQFELGLDTVAVAYRPLTSKEKPEKLSAQTAEKDLVVLGLVAVGHSLKHEAVIAVQAAQSKGIAVSLLSSGNEAVSAAICRQLGLGEKPTVLTDISQIDNGRLAGYLSSGNAIFMHLNPEQKLRLVDVAEQANRRVLITGSSLSDVPALRHASVGASLGTAPAIVRAEADIVAVQGDLHALTRAHGRAVQTAEHLTESIWASLTNHAAAVWLTLLGFAELAIWHVPLAITAIQLLLLNALVLLPPSVALGRDKSHRHFTNEDSATQLAYHSHWSSVMMGLIAAVLVGTNFLYFFSRQNLSPSFIDSSSRLYAQASSIGFAALVICGCINILFVRAEKLPLFTARQLWHNATLTCAFLVSLALLAALIYVPALQDFAGTGALTVGDWLTILAVTFVYAGVRYIAHAERLHSRHAIVQLHHEVHGEHSSAEI